MCPASDFDARRDRVGRILVTVLEVSDNRAVCRVHLDEVITVLIREHVQLRLEKPSIPYVVAYPVELLPLLLVRGFDLKFLDR